MLVRQRRLVSPEPRVEIKHVAIDLPADLKARVIAEIGGFAWNEIAWGRRRIGQRPAFAN